MSESQDHKATIYTTRLCGFCYRAKRLFDAKNTAYKEIPVDGNQQARKKLAQITGSTTVPQIWIGETYVGGCDDLYALERQGKLDKMLS